MSKAKMLAARELIQEKNYEEARALLKTVNSPTARRWLERLDQIAPPITHPVRTGFVSPVIDRLIDAEPEIAAQRITRSGAIMPPDETLLALRAAWLPRLTADAEPKARAVVGRALGQLKLSSGELLDNRPGVGVIVREDGLKLPDIAWSEPIPPGEYPLGGDDKAWESLPAETYRLTYSYQLSKYPVTNAQFQVFVDAGYNNPTYWTEAGLKWKGDRRAPDEHGDMNFRLANHPRIYVKWYEAMAYCAWLTEVYRETGVIGPEEVIRLPQEKEWESAARGPEGLLFPYGNDFDASKGNADDTGIGQTSAVGIFPSGVSWRGAEDMSGNVWEWCLNPSNDPDGGLKPENVGSVAVRGLRGGSWGFDDNFARAASRFYHDPSFRGYVIGFRLLCLPRRKTQKSPLNQAQRVARGRL